jgi:DNA topoisomerase-1
VKHGKINASVPENTDIDAITLEQAMEWINAKAATKKTKGGKRSTTSPLKPLKQPRPPKSSGTKKASATKKTTTTKKKTTRKSPPPSHLRQSQPLPRSQIAK